METFSEKRYRDIGIAESFVQDNRSASRHGVLRGLHYQINQPQGHLVYLYQGRLFDVGVDLRPESPTFGEVMTHTIDADAGTQLYWPPGVAHGFCVLSETADVAYKCTDYYAPGDEGGVRWDDAELGIPWPIENPEILERDRSWPLLREIPADRLPRSTAQSEPRA